VLGGLYELTKPERTLANVITAASGFLLASRWQVNWGLFIATLVGITLVIGSACVVNNLMDRRIDQKMTRSQHRALPSGTVSQRTAAVEAVVLGVAGFLILGVFVNWLVFWLGVVAYIDYVVIYSTLKRMSVYGALAGSISGSLSIVGGYCAVRGHIDAGAVILFLILTTWQMPHFYAISIFRLRDYQSAKIPVLPAKRGIRKTKIEMIIWTALFMIVASGLTLFHYTGVIYLVVAEAIGLYWLWKIAKGLKAANDTTWARNVFLTSLVVNLVLAVMIPVGALLP
jgi:protoheme IX farnesyltransferase